MNLHLYEACGNKFFIVHLKDEQSLYSLKNSPQDLLFLADAGKEENVDSIMVISGNPLDFEKYGYHVSMEVFEPHSYDVLNHLSGWSTMCGNGIRGVAQYLVNLYNTHSDFIIQTRAGKQKVSWHTDLWKVDMGYFTPDATCLKKYITTVPHTVSEFFNDTKSLFLKTEIFVGLHYQPENKNIDGEPHLVVFCSKPLSEQELIPITKKIGEVITPNTHFFPEEINTSVVSIESIDTSKKIIRVHAATYERHIHYVTQACGTAATVIGSILFQQYNLDSQWQVEVSMPGGKLSIEKDVQGRFYLLGEAKQLSYVRTSG